MYTDQELSKNAIESYIDNNPKKLHEYEAGRNSIGLLVREIGYLEGSKLFDETQKSTR